MGQKFDTVWNATLTTLKVYLIIIVWFWLIMLIFGILGLMIGGGSSTEGYSVPKIDRWLPIWG